MFTPNEKQRAAVIALDGKWHAGDGVKTAAASLGIRGDGNFSRYLARIEGMTPEQFEQAVKVIENKPSWDDAPIAAEYLTQDNDGLWKFHTKENYPHLALDGEFFWVSGRILYGGKQKGHCFGDWRESFETRPLTNKNKTQDSEKDSGYPSKEEQDIMAEEIQKEQRSMDTDDVKEPEYNPEDVAFKRGVADSEFPVKSQLEKDIGSILSRVGGEWSVSGYRRPNNGEWFISGIGDVRKCLGEANVIRIIVEKVKNKEETERESTIEKALSFDCKANEGMLSRTDFCGALYDAGMLQLPEEKP